MPGGTGIPGHSYIQLNKRWEGHARNLYIQQTGGLTFFTDSERVSNKARLADTDGVVSPDLALGIDAASVSVARVDTLLPNACKVPWAFFVIDTFWSWCCK